MNKIKEVKVLKNPKDGRTTYNLFKSFKNIKNNFEPRSKLIVANMELVNGDIELHIVKVTSKSFKLFNQRYLVNEDFLKYNRTLKMWEGKYHESLSCPVNQNVPVNKIIKELKKVDNPEIQDIINNVDPAILESFTKTQIIQKVFAGELMQNIFGFIKIMLILILVGVCASAFILISGVMH